MCTGAYWWLGSGRLAITSWVEEKDERNVALPWESCPLLLVPTHWHLTCLQLNTRGPGLGGNHYLKFKTKKADRSVQGHLRHTGWICGT